MSQNERLLVTGNGLILLQMNDGIMRLFGLLLLQMGLISALQNLKSLFS
jgi:hypothetical protein